MNMETNTDLLVETAKKVPTPKPKAKKADRAWIEKAHAEAAAHNAKRLPLIGGRPFIHGDARTIGESSAEVKAEFQKIESKLAIGACYLIFWATFGAMVIGLILS